MPPTLANVCSPHSDVGHSKRKAQWLPVTLSCETPSRSRCLLLQVVTLSAYVIARHGSLSHVVCPTVVRLLMNAIGMSDRGAGNERNARPARFGDGERSEQAGR